MIVFDEQNTQTRELAIIQWYEEVFPVAALYIKRKGGELEEAKEVFQQAIVLYYEKLMLKDFKPQVSDKAYLMGIVKKQWLKHRQQVVGNERIEQIEISEDNIQIPLTHKLLLYLQKSGAKCMNLL
ncbi:hypothetical protein GCM10011506_04890 [Marivirga lumbricoides]|uniref:RNA polymerase sigma-70 region 2 domain-containing protein n=2 Tax=Marivirga lumbricoides TaxID=1046115 RepID=A0ABQ1LF98_9BACT|nr:hypothetical protein GCM10011506_04890 [Marivirga lumbricoides]